ncbi:hypothetical protein [Zavarzinia compransoris]|uniref:hypothetical protein n=1 Tax=Zavarzinia compransoris TaxID=1264899 RepID=UPI001415017D|nr:hypothetical protein [Zavarzinia compransoris]
MHQPTILYDLPEAEYHARTEISKHGLDLVQVPPLYRLAKDGPPAAPTAAKIAGRAL